MIKRSWDKCNQNAKMIVIPITFYTQLALIRYLILIMYVILIKVGIVDQKNFLKKEVFTLTNNMN